MMSVYCFFSLAVAVFVSISTVTRAVENSDNDDTLQYSMSSYPPVDSPVETEILDFFVEDLSHIAKYIRVAYNGVGAAGPRFQDLQNKIQRLGFDISRLCDKSAITIASYKTTTRTVLVELKYIYQYLVDDMEIMALDSFSILAELAGKMAKTAENLQREFERQEANIIDTLEHTMSRRAMEEIRTSDLKEQQKKTEANVKRQEELVREHKKLEAEYREERHRYEREEDKAMSSKSGFLSRLGNAISSSFGLGNLFDDDSVAELKANRWRQKSIEKLENEKEQRKLKHEALQLMAELVDDIKHNMEEEAKLSEVAVNALYKASGSLKHLIVLLKHTALFWNQLKAHCQGLADDKFQQKIEKFAENFSKEERKKHWTSKQFKREMSDYISNWNTLYSASSVYLEQIKVTRQDLLKYITENPTHEESKNNLRMLVQDFEKDLKSAEEKIKEQDFKADKEIRQLKAEQKTEL